MIISSDRVIFYIYIFFFFNNLFLRSEYGTLWRPLVGALSYVVTQIIKMVIIAGLINLSPLWEHLIDCFGMYYFLIHQQKATVASVKILSKIFYFIL